jgi:hypothetical protein
MRYGHSGEVKRRAEKFYGAVHIRCLLEVDAHPATFRKDVMVFRLSGRHQFFADLSRERDVDEMVAMHMADLSPGETIFRPSKAMRASDDAGKRTHHSSDLLCGSWNWHANP